MVSVRASAPSLILLISTAVLVAAPIVHVVRAVEHVPYRSWHPINIGLLVACTIVAVGWVRYLSRHRWASALVHGCWNQGMLLALSLWAVLSTVWSVAPGRSALWGLHGLAMTLAYFVVARCISLATLRRASLTALVLMLLGSMAALLLAPEYARNQDPLYGGAWRGLFAQKNHLGLLAGLTLVLSALRSGPLVLRGVGASLAIVVLVGSRSGTGALTALAGLGTVALVLGLSRLERRHRVRAVTVAGVVALGLSAVLALRWEPALRAVGRDPSLTGRTVLWSFAGMRISERPLSGFGFRAFFERNDAESIRAEEPLKRQMGEATLEGRSLRWQPNAPALLPSAEGRESLQGPRSPAVDTPKESGKQKRRPPHWRVSHAHNGILQLTLDLGAVGLLFFLLWCARQLLPAVRTVLRDGHDADGLATLALSAALLGHNLLEVSLLRTWFPEGLMWGVWVVHLVAHDPNSVVRCSPTARAVHSSSE